MHRNDLVLRDALARDLDAMVGMLRQLFGIETDFAFDERKQRHGLAALMADHGRSVVRVAESHHKIVGMCTAQINISTAEGGMSALVEDMIVDATYRGKGVGTALLKSIELWASEHQCVRMQLLADFNNTPAFEFYANAGWHRTNMVCCNKKIGFDCIAAIVPPRQTTMSARR
jgi:GNAT superfamily N-acetyltransferase